MQNKVEKKFEIAELDRRKLEELRRIERRLGVVLVAYKLKAEGR